MRLIIYFIVFSSVSTFAAVEGQEQFEKGYKEFWSKPVENWNEIIKNKKTETYTVRKKDTLSELSEVFFGTPNYWPKIWSLNNYIGNPHLIYPGNQIGFYMGSVEGGAPQVFLNDNPKEKPGTSIYSLDDPQIKIPPEPKELPVLDQIPQSFPSWQSVGVDSGNPADSEHVERQFSKLDSNVMKFHLTSFLHQGDLKTYGEVKGFLNVDFDAASSFDEVFIKRSEPLPLGQVYTLVMPRNKAKTSEGKVLRDIYIYEYVGEVKIIEDNTDKNGLVSGRIVRAYDMINKGALLILGKIPEYDLKYNIDDLQPIEAKLLRGSEIFGHNILGVGQTVFISQGEKQGITAGTLLQIQQDRTQRNPQGEALDIVNKIGIVKIVSSTPDVSTGIVVSSRDFMIPGDKTIE